MELINLKIERIIIHQIFQRNEDGNKKPPIQSHELTLFDKSAMDEFKSRVIDALGEGSKAVEMEIVKQGKDDIPRIVDIAINQKNEDFTVSSFDFAQKLSNVQQSRQIPGGIVVIFSGSYGYPQSKFLGVIKAEIHSAYQKEINPETKEISLKFVQEVLLTPGTRLYKTAGFFEKPIKKSNLDLNEKYSVLISDYQISKADGKAAAQYFYSDFLGCGYPNTSARSTKQFFDATHKFISDLNVSSEKKIDLFNALTTYLKVATSSTISIKDFGSNYFDNDLQDEYKNYMEDYGIPNTAFTKDLEHIESHLKFRKLNFSRNVKIIAPSEVFKELITVETIEGPLDENGIPKNWTKVIIKDNIITQE